MYRSFKRRHLFPSLLKNIFFSQARLRYVARQSLRVQHVSPAYSGSAGPPQAVDMTAAVAAADDVAAAVASADDVTAAVATADAVRAAVMMADDGPNSRNPDCVWTSPDSRRRGRAGPRRNSRTQPCPRCSCLQK
jgi:hypothetical protein